MASYNDQLKAAVFALCLCNCLERELKRRVDKRGISTGLFRRM
ncbi:unnamed protein product [Musa banksii]